jgi:hypothetical protein
MTIGRRRIIVFDDELERLVAEKMQRTGSTNWAGTLKAAARRRLIEEQFTGVLPEDYMKLAPKGEE